MALQAGRSLGVYTIGELLGAGGMGEVYRARDTRLGRSVALKVLPEAVAHDRDRLARFTREAQALAALNHPHIAAIYGLEESDGTSALVLELIEGPTLADRLRRGPLLVDDALVIAGQIAEALESAHMSGIIHRDLKPANIKITPSGSVKVLDFGLAKVYEDDSPARALSLSPTISGAGTRFGVILGTAAYMSPEQARGSALDKRADIWAFGCVLFEMLTGRAAFGADTVSDIIVAVLSREPDWQALPATTPPLIVSLLKRCLQKEPGRRMRDIADARFLVEEARSAAPLPGARVGRRTGVRYAGWLLAALITAAAAIVAARFLPLATPEPPEMRLQLVTPSVINALHFAISPDGRQIVYAAAVDGRTQLWLRAFNADEGRPVKGTDGASLPFWSPDGRAVGFFANGELRRVELDGGFVRTLASAPNPRRGAWSSDGTILFGASVGPLYRVSAVGGAVEEATSLLPGQSNHRWPKFLPDNQRFLLFGMGTREVRGLYLGSLNDKTVRRVMDAESEVAIVPPAHVLFARQGGLWAQRLNAEYTRAEGETFPVAPRILVDPSVNGWAALSSSALGSIAYRPAGETRQLVWFDRLGRQVGVAGPPDDAQPLNPWLSPDERTVVLHRMVNGNTDLWLIDVARGVPRRLTFDPSIDGDAVFSPDGSRVLYVSDRKTNVWDMYERAADGTGGETLLLESGENKNPRDWSSDGRYILYASQSTRTGADIWALPLSGERKPVAVAQTPFAEFDARFSPDGRWVAFESDEAGRMEIYIQPFPGPGAKLQVSLGGGRAPRWAHSGELFYIAPDNRLMAVPIVIRGSTLDAAAPKALFTLPDTKGYQPSHDGQRFLVNKTASEAPPLTIMLNWKPPSSR